jgi:hypothetical protein
MPPQVAHQHGARVFEGFSLAVDFKGFSKLGTVTALYGMTSARRAII